MESLRYVVLYAFSDRPRTADSEEQPPGFTFLSNTTAAYTRITCTLSDKRFLDCFGIGSDSTSEPKELLMAMRKFFFFDNGKHVGARILDNADFPRVFNESAAVEFMGEVNAKSIKSTVATQSVQSSLPLDTAASVAPVPSVLRIVHALLISSAQQGTLNVNGTTSDSDLSVKGRQGKENKMYGSHMELN
ncbi:hypothetical protein GGI17_006709 [Coemansia sp. S146]|nr:hypothetical protein GGI17_006709 [Coemansia sp. S146]